MPYLNYSRGHLVNAALPLKLFPNEVSAAVLNPSMIGRYNALLLLRDAIPLSMQIATLFGHRKGQAKHSLNQAERISSDAFGPILLDAYLVWRPRVTGLRAITAALYTALMAEDDQTLHDL